jgi:predicted GH43/DUF377 family glycosyl hydrolase
MEPAELFRRYDHNPLFTFRQMPYPCHSVFNTGATLLPNGETLLLLRVEDLEGRSHLTVARSEDGVTEWRIEDRPLLHPDDGDPYEAYGCEDARITRLEEEDAWVIAYTAYSPYGAGVALAKTRDWKTVERLGLMLAPNNKDAAVFPRKIRGKYWMLHRPVAGSLEHIWLTDSPDLRHWGSPYCIIKERGGPFWDGRKVGANTPPIETPEGWLILYHGVKQMPGGPTYRMGAALLDLEDPRRLISRLPHWILAPHEWYEVTGDVPNVVFACGAVERGDEIHLYYGAADTYICLAYAKTADLLDALLAHKVNSRVPAGVSY